MLTDDFTKLAAIKSFYESGNDFRDTFSFFVLLCLDSSPKTPKDVQQLLMSEFSIDMPTSFILSLFKRLRKNGLIEYDEFAKGVWLTSEGDVEVEKLNSSAKEAARKTNELLVDIQTFIKKKYNKDYSVEKIKEELLLFLEDSTYQASFFLTGEEEMDIKDSSDIFDLDLSKYLAAYFQEAEKNNSHSYDQLKILAQGAIISIIVKNRDLAEKIRRKFKSTILYLDTNIIFSLLGLHDEHLNRSTQELLKLIKRFGFQLYIFPFTKEELISVLKGYMEGYYYYPESPFIDSIYAKLRQQKKTKEDVALMIVKIDEILEKLGVSIDYVNVSPYIKSDSPEWDRIKKWKKDKEKPSNLHDIKVVKSIQSLRSNKSIHILEEAEYLFVTCDKRLFRYNYFEHKHGLNDTVPEIILADALADILWLKNPNEDANLPIHNIVAGITRKLLISNELWEKFIFNLRVFRESGDIDEDSMQLLISSKETIKVLQDVQSKEGVPRDVSAITERIIEKISKNDKRLKESLRKFQSRADKSAGEARKLREQNLRTKDIVTDLEIQNNEKNREIAAINEYFLGRCQKKWKWIINVMIVIIMVAIGYVIFEWVNDDEFKSDEIINMGEVVLMIGTIFLFALSAFAALFGKKFLFFDFVIKGRRILENYFIKRCLASKKAEIDEIIDGISKG